eukprot:PhM_4_TR12052/c0_g2_i1/m.33642
MGQGGCDVGREVGRAIICFLCCCICAGPICLTVGLVYVLKPNTRDDDVSQYNAAVATWESGGYRESFSDLYVYGAGTDLPGYVRAVAIGGNTDGVELSTTSFAYEGNAMTPMNMTLYIQTRTRRNVNRTSSFYYPVQLSHTKTTSLWCRNGYTTDQNPSATSSSTRTTTTGSSSSSSSSNSNFRPCTSVSIARCPSGSTSYQGTSYCKHNTHCGTCTQLLYLTRACIFLSGKGDTFTASATISGCSNPFQSNHEYNSAVLPSTVSLRVMHERDPYVALEQITDGSSDFGMTEQEQKAIGLTLLAVGAVICGVLLCIGCVLTVHSPSRKRFSEMAA